MSRETEALIQGAYEAYGWGDTAPLLELVHPSLEWTYLDPADADPQPQVCYGRDQLKRALRRQAEQGLKSEVEEVASSGDKVMVVARTPGADQRRAWQNGDHNYLVLTLAGGQVVAMHAFQTRDEARSFAGLD